MAEKKFNIYTKTGDQGTTALIGGKRVKKNHIRIEAYGTVDELISYTGFLRDQKINTEIIKCLVVIQDKLMRCASILATDPSAENIKNPELTENDVVFLEKEIDKMEKNLPALTSFILPGGSSPSSISHICRTICRRAERRVLDLSESEKIEGIVIRYLNRLSDYFFVLSRKINMDLNAKEIPWKPKL